MATSVSANRQKFSMHQRFFIAGMRIEIKTGQVEAAVVALEVERPHQFQIEVETQVAPVHLGRDLVVTEPLPAIRQVKPAFRRKMIVADRLAFGADRIELRGVSALVLPFLQMLAVLCVEEADMRHDPLAVTIAITALQVEQKADRAHVGFGQFQLARLRLESEIELKADRAALAESVALDGDVLRAGRAAVLRSSAHRKNPCHHAIRRPSG